MSLHLENAPRETRLAATLAELGFERTAPAPFVEDALRVGPSTFRVTASRGSMETRVSITVLGPSRDAAHDVMGRAFEEMDRVVPLLNRHSGSSALATLNAQGRLRDAPRELSDVVHEAIRLHRLSAGAFDVSVKPVVDLRKATRDPIPTDVLALVDMSAVRLSPGSIRLEKSGMGLTLDGIAKGYVVDRMAAVLQRHGMTRWLIDAGGDIRASGRKEDDRPWRIGVKDPHKKGDYPAVLDVATGAIATSGAYENYYDSDRLTHHIVDSATGRSPALIHSATVQAPTAMMADALATAVFVMPPSAAVTLIDALPHCACLLLDAQGRQYGSRRLRSIQPSTT